MFVTVYPPKVIVQQQLSFRLKLFYRYWILLKNLSAKKKKKGSFGSSQQPATWCVTVCFNVQIVRKYIVYDHPRNKVYHCNWKPGFMYYLMLHCVSSVKRFRQPSDCSFLSESSASPPSDVDIGKYSKRNVTFYGLLKEYIWLSLHVGPENSRSGSY